MSQDDELKDALNPDTEGADVEIDNLFDEDDGLGDEPGAGKEIDWESRAKRAEAKIVESKRAEKLAPKIDPAKAGDVESIVKRTMQEENFYKENPDLKERRKEIDEYVNKWLSYDQAKTLVTTDERKRETNQKRSNSQRVTWSPKPSQSRFSMAELGEMDQKEYNSIMERREKWEVEIVG